MQIIQGRRSNVPDSGIIARFHVSNMQFMSEEHLLFLIWLVFSLRIPNLGHHVIFLVEDVVADACQVGVLEVGIKILKSSAWSRQAYYSTHHFDYAVADGILVFFL